MTDFSPIEEISEMFKELHDRKIPNNLYYNGRKLSNEAITIIGEILAYKAADIMRVAKTLSHIEDHSVITNSTIKTAASMVFDYESVNILSGQLTMSIVPSAMPAPYRQSQQGSYWNNNQYQSWPSQANGSSQASEPVVWATTAQDQQSFNNSSANGTNSSQG